MDDSERALQEEFNRRVRRSVKADADFKAGLITEEECNEAFFAGYRMILARGRELHSQRQDMLRKSDPTMEPPKVWRE